MWVRPVELPCPSARGRTCGSVTGCRQAWIREAFGTGNAVSKVNRRRGLREGRLGRGAWGGALGEGRARRGAREGAREQGRARKRTRRERRATVALEGRR